MSKQTFKSYLMEQFVSYHEVLEPVEKKEKTKPEEKEPEKDCSGDKKDMIIAKVKFNPTNLRKYLQINSVN